jgi:hypothetical protein
VLCREGQNGWPSVRVLLQLWLFTTLFPLSDNQHPVGIPFSLLIGLLLSSCPLQQPPDIAVALFLASLLQGIAKEGGRYAPEVTPLCEALLHSAVQEASRPDECAPNSAMPSGACGSIDVVPGWEAVPLMLSPDLCYRMNRIMKG